MVRTTSDKVQIGRIERSLVEQTKQYKKLKIQFKNGQRP